MSLEADAIVERRRLKRRVSFWRAGAILALFLGVFALIASDKRFAAELGLTDQIARVTISGFIQDDRKQQTLFKTLAEDASVKAIILHVNSPGGTTTGGEALYYAVRGAAEKKPVVAVFGTVAASAAYMLALGSDHIVARGNTITGSVGTIIQWAEVSRLLESIGVTVNEVKSGALKAVPSPFQPLDPAGRAVTEEMAMESVNWFLGLVAERRNLVIDRVPGLRDGRIYSGRMAKDRGLVDAIGGEAEALAWLETAKGIKRSTPVIDRKPAADGDFGFAQATGQALGAVLVPLVAGIAQQAGHHVPSTLDGLVSVWQPATGQ